MAYALQSLWSSETVTHWGCCLVAESGLTLPLVNWFLRRTA